MSYRASLARSVLSLLVATLWAAPSPGAWARSSEPAERAASFSTEAEAVAFVGHFSKGELQQDEVFVRALKELASSDLSPDAQADAFILMQEELGWLFVGGLNLFPDRGYAQTLAMMLTTYAQYQEAIPESTPIAGLLKLARTSEHPLRPSNALLLATILDRKAARDAVCAAIDESAILKTAIPPLTLHNLAMAVSLTRDVTCVRKLPRLLARISWEEGREDLIAATTLYRDEAIQQDLWAFVERELPTNKDLSVSTALYALARMSEGSEAFRQRYTALIESMASEEDREWLRALGASGFEDPILRTSRQGLVKIWAGFTVTTLDDGTKFEYGDAFRYWRGR